MREGDREGECDIERERGRKRVKDMRDSMLHICIYILPRH